jgi:F-type H+-transporting ATPase subunit b
MLEIELKWFIVQLINFLFLLVFLNIILFRPLLRLFKEREDNTKGALENAKALDKEKDDVLARIDAKLADGRSQAKKIYENLAGEGMEMQKGSLESAQKEAVEINRTAKEELEAASEQARAALKADIENFSKQIVKKLVGA